MRIVKLANAWSNWATEADKAEPWNPEGATAWLGYLDLAEQLGAMEMWTSALRMINLVANVLPSSCIVQALEGLIARCPVTGSVEQRHVKLAASQALSRHWANKNNFLKARDEYNMTKEYLGSLEVSQQKALDSSSLGLDLEWTLLLAWPNAERMATARAAEALGRSARKLCSFGQADFFYTEACEIALQCYASNEFSTWRQTQEDFMLNVMGDLPDLIMGRTRQWSLGNVMDQYAQVEWFDNFGIVQPLAIAAVSDEGNTGLLDAATRQLRAPDFDVPLVLYMKYTALRSIFKRIGNTKREWECELHLRSLDEDIPRSDLSKNMPLFLQDWLKVEREGGLAAIRVLIRRLCQASNLHDLNPTQRNDILGPVDIDNTTSEEVQIQAFAQLYFGAENLNYWDKRIGSIRKWLSLDDDLIKPEAAAFLIVQLQLLRCSKVTLPAEGIEQNQVLLKFIEDCRDEAREFIMRIAQNARSVIAMCKLALVPIPEPPGVYDEIIQIHAEVLDSYITNPHLQRFAVERAIQYIRLADVSQRKRRAQQEPSLETIQKYLQGAEIAFDEIRQDMSAMQPSESVKEKSRISTIINGVIELEKIGYRVYRLELLRSPNDRAVKIRLWEWIQRSKGRALTDSLGLRMRAPATMLAKIKSHHAKKKFNEWETVNSKILESVKSAPHPNRAYDMYYLRKQRQDMAEEMRQIDELKEIANLTEGRTMRFRELNTLFAQLKKQPGCDSGEIVLLDWFEVSNIANQAQWYLAIVRSSSVPGTDPRIEINQIPTMSGLVNRWISAYLTPTNEVPASQHSDKVAKGQSGPVPTHAGASGETDDPLIKALENQDAYEKLQAFQPLLAPLGNVRQGEDTVVLCPFKTLHRLPIHAIEIPSAGTKSPLLCQHRVVYCHSLSILGYCAISRANQVEGSLDSARTHAVGFFPLRTGINDYGLRTSFEEAFDQEAIKDQNVQRDVFLQRSNNASELFFFGHVHDKPNQPLESHLCLHEPTLHDQARCSEADAYTVKAGDILDLVKLSEGAHASLIGCASGTAFSLNSEDYLGIVPATLYAGARSTISTLWPIYQADGVDFSRSLFELIADEDPHSRLWRMADYMRQAVLDLRRRRGDRNLAAWAAFVFHGL